MKATEQVPEFFPVQIMIETQQELDTILGALELIALTAENNHKRTGEGMHLELKEKAEQIRVLIAEGAGL